MRRETKVTWIKKEPAQANSNRGWIEIDARAVKQFAIPIARASSEFRTKQVGSAAYEYIYSPKRQTKIGKPFTLNIAGEIVRLKIQKTLTQQQVLHWLRSWAPANTLLTTPGGRCLTLDEQSHGRTKPHYVYFILNAENDAVKIGKAKDVRRRLSSLQTASPTQLQLINVIQVDGEPLANQLEKELHQRFGEYRLLGEWFRYTETIATWIEKNAGASTTNQ